LDRKIIFNTL